MIQKGHAKSEPIQMPEKDLNSVVLEPAMILAIVSTIK
jgi:hypothetical protein